MKQLDQIMTIALPLKVRNRNKKNHVVVFNYVFAYLFAWRSWQFCLELYFGISKNKVRLVCHFERKSDTNLRQFQ